MLCSEFKKPGGGKGRPGRNIKCQDCGATWGAHGTAQKLSPSIVKRGSKPIRHEIPAEALIEAPTSETIAPKIMDTESPTTLEILEEVSPNLDGATSLAPSDLITEEAIDLPLENIPMQEIKKETIKAKIDIYAIAAEIFR
jgi:hypothetical protein